MWKPEWLGWARGADEDSMKISAVWIDGGTFTNVGIALSAVGMTTIHLTRAEELLAGKPPSDDLFGDEAVARHDRPVELAHADPGQHHQRREPHEAAEVREHGAGPDRRGRAQGGGERRHGQGGHTSHGLPIGCARLCSSQNPAIVRQPPSGLRGTSTSTSRNTYPGANRTEYEPPG